MKIYFNKPEHKLNFGYRTNFKTLLLDCESLHKAVVFHVHDTQYIGQFKAIDQNHRTIELNRFTCNGDSIYYKINNFEWRNFSIDNIDYIEIPENVPNIEFFKGVAV